MRYTRRILFLDIDGVLTTSRVIDHGMWAFDPRCVEQLNALVTLANPEIVISSTWRRMYTLDELRDKLAAAGFAYPSMIIDATPTHITREAKNSEGSLIELAAFRGQEIESWCETNAVTARQIVILDDDRDMYPLHSRLVQTNFADGLTTADVAAALRLFGISVRREEVCDATV